MTALEQFERIAKAWAQLIPLVSKYYKIGPFTVCLTFAHAGLEKEMTMAFHHLTCNPVDQPDLTICLWDTATTKQKLPELNWELIYRNGYHGYCEKSIYLHYFDSIDALSAFHAEKNQAYYIVRNTAALPWWVGASPLQVILHAWLRSHGAQLTHTAAIANNQGAILLTGKGGSGKSTTTLACLTEGFDYIGEDYCILMPKPTPHVYSIYQSAKWEQNTRKMFPTYEQYIMNTQTANSEKALVFYQDIFPTQIKTTAPIRAIVSLKIGQQKKPVIEKQNIQHALKDLMMSTLMQLPWHHVKTMTLLQDITLNVPCYQLTLGQQLKENTHVIRKILS